MKSAYLLAFIFLFQVDLAEAKKSRKPPQNAVEKNFQVLAEKEIRPDEKANQTLSRDTQHAQIENSILNLSLASNKPEPRNWKLNLNLLTEWYQPQGWVSIPELQNYDLNRMSASPLMKLESSVGWSLFQASQDLSVGLGYGFANQSYNLKNSNQVEIPASLLTQVFYLNMSYSWKNILKELWGSKWNPGIVAQVGEYQLYQNSGNSFARWSSQTRFLSLGPRFDYPLTQRLKLLASYHWRFNSVQNEQQPRLNSQLELGVSSVW